jgi:hypothetical protein
MLLIRVDAGMARFRRVRQVKSRAGLGGLVRGALSIADPVEAGKGRIAISAKV